MNINKSSKSISSIKSRLIEKRPYCRQTDQVHFDRFLFFIEIYIQIFGTFRLLGNMTED